MTDIIDSRPTRYAVIPTHNRPLELRRLLNQLNGQCDVAVIVDNASDPPVSVDDDDELARVALDVHVVRDAEQPPNLARLWNVGFERARVAAGGVTADRWDVAVFNDDADVPPGWYDYVAGALRTYDVLAASADSYGHVKSPLVRREPNRDLMTRMCPWAFVLRGECGVEADEKLRWWWQDTDIEWRLALAGGVVVMPGYVVHNTGANSTTHGELAEQAGRDRRTFAEKWGYNPW